MRNATGHAGSGRRPDPNALRRDRPSDKAEWFHLPSTGRAGDPPEWPLTRQNQREKVHWIRLWSLPQAVAWEASHLLDAVASYVRALAVAEAGNARAADRTLARQYQDTLGLTDAGLRANRWIIDGQVEQEIVKPNDPARRSAKARLTSIEGGIAS